MNKKLKEECGVFGVYSNNQEKLAYTTYVGLTALQHRGEESCGIAINTKRVFSHYKEKGLVSEVFTNEVLENMPKGNISIGHVRYSTTGGDKKENVQPIVIKHKKGNMAIAHNGNIINAGELKKKLEDQGAIFTATTDTEVIAHIIVRERLKSKSIEEAVAKSMKILQGSYSLLVMSPQKLIACRDPYGFRPLCMGKLGENIVFASESCALDICGAQFIRDVKPGELIVVKDGNIESSIIIDKPKKSMCIFEYIYFARPDSIIENMSVHEFRELTGRYLATQNLVQADMVAAVPDSGIDAALRIFKRIKNTI